MKLKDHGSREEKKTEKRFGPGGKKKDTKKRRDSGDSRAKANKNILKLTYGFAALFIMMAAYLGWFIQFKSENVIGSSYNARLDQFSDRIIRGKYTEQRQDGSGGNKGCFRQNRDPLLSV